MESICGWIFHKHSLNMTDLDLKQNIFFIFPQIELKMTQICFDFFFCK